MDDYYPRISQYIYIYIYINIYIYIRVCVRVWVCVLVSKCVCMCVWLGSSLSCKHVWLNNKDTFCLYSFKSLSSFLISVLVLGWNWWINLSKLSRALLKCLHFFFKYSLFLDYILFLLIAFCFLNSSASQFYPILRLRNFVTL